MVTGVSRKETRSEGEKIELELFALLQEMLRELHPLMILPTIRPESLLQDELGIDSLARAELITRIEQRFQIHLPDVAIMSAERVADLTLSVRTAILHRVRPKTNVAVPEKETVMALPFASAPDWATTLTEVLEWRAARDPHRVWTRFYGDDGRIETLTYGNLLEKAREVATGLRAYDLPARSAVALMLPTSLEFFYCFYGVLLGGGIPVPLYPPDRPSRVEEHIKRQIKILQNSEASLLIASPDLRPLRGILKGMLPRIVSLVEPQEVQASVSDHSFAPLDGEDIAFLQYTSGSTGDPKGVVLSHSNLLANLRAIGEVIRPVETDVFVSWLPLYHDMGLIGAGMGTLYFGVPLVLMSPLRFLARPERWLWAIHEHRGTLSAAPNFAYEICARKVQDSQIAGLNLNSWRAAFNGAEPVSASTLQRFQQRFQSYGLRSSASTPIYGLAESTVGLSFPPVGRGPVVDYVDRDAFFKEERAIPVREGARALATINCGPPLPKHEVRIVDSTDCELPERGIGRIQFRGPSSTSGYYRNPGATRSLFHGDWLDTGDYGYLANGELYITGRAKDLIIRAGRHIFPYEIEEWIGNLPEVRKGGVAVFGKKDQVSGTEEIIVLAELRQPTLATEALKQTIRDQVVGFIGIPPDDIVLAPPRSVLKTPSGKIRRSECLRLYELGALGKAVPLWKQWVRLRCGSLIPWTQRALRRSAIVMYGIYFWGVCLILGIPGVLGLLLLPKEEWRVDLCKALLWMIWRLTGTVTEVSGLENLIRHSPQIVVANHSSYIDSPFLGSVLAGKFSFIAKKDFRHRFFKFLLKRIGTLFVERFEMVTATKDTEEIIRAVREKRSLVVFPEGTFTRAAGLRPFQMGAFIVSARSGAPVVPVTLHGTRSLLRAEWMLPRRCKVRVTIGRPIWPKDSSWAEAIRIRDEARREILRHCGEPDLGQ